MRFYAYIGLLLLLLPTRAVAQNDKNKAEGTIQITSGSESGVITVKKTLPVRLEWVSPKFPKSGEVVSVYKKLNIEVKAFTEAELRDGDFKVFVDGKPLGGKSGERPLVIDKAKKEYIFRRTVEIPADEGRHPIRVVCNNNGVEERSKTLIVQSTQTAPTVSINWKSPDVTELAGRALQHSDPYLEISADIETGGTALDLSQVKIKYNGAEHQPNETNASLFGSGSRYAFRYKQAMLNSGEVQTLSILVEGIESDILNIRYSTSKKPRLYILAIGTQTNLTYTVQDALDFAAIFEAQKNGSSLYSEINVESLTKAKANTQSIRVAVNRLNTKMNTSEINPNDLVILYISTHGFFSPDGDFRLQGDDFSSGEADATSISFESDVMKVLRRMNCKKLIFMDACHSSGPFDPRNGGKGSVSDVDAALAKYNEFRSGIAILASSQSDELSYEDARWKNGAFTEAIVKGLSNGEADTAPKNNIITVRELAQYLEKTVPEMVRNVKGADKKQKPRLHDPDMIKDLPIYIKG
jgi:hypothetical protein